MKTFGMWPSSWPLTPGPTDARGKAKANTCQGSEQAGRAPTWAWWKNPGQLWRNLAQALSAAGTATDWVWGRQEEGSDLREDREEVPIRSPLRWSGILLVSCHGGRIGQDTISAAQCLGHPTPPLGTWVHSPSCH